MTCLKRRIKHPPWFCARGVKIWRRAAWVVIDWWPLRKLSPNQGLGLCLATFIIYFALLVPIFGWTITLDLAWALRDRMRQWWNVRDIRKLPGYDPVREKISAQVAREICQHCENKDPSFKIGISAAEYMGPEEIQSVRMIIEELTVGWGNPDGYTVAKFKDWDLKWKVWWIECKRREGDKATT